MNMEWNIEHSSILDMLNPEQNSYPHWIRKLGAGGIFSAQKNLQVATHGRQVWGCR